MKIKKIIKQVIDKLLWRHGFVLTSLVIQNDKVVTSEFDSLYQEIKKYSLTNMERAYALYKAVQYILDARIPGDFVECGVWRGGSAFLIAKMLKSRGISDRKIYLYDTFEGMSAPTEHDFKVGRSFATTLKIWDKKEREGGSDWCYASVDDVKSVMNKSGYPPDNIVYVKGMVEDTIPTTLPESIALLRLDTDFYESTKHELTYLYGLLSQGGVLLIDDYGVWQGSKKAVDEFFSTHPNPILLNRIDLEGRIGVKVTK